MVDYASKSWVRRSRLARVIWALWTRARPAGKSPRQKFRAREAVDGFVYVEPVPVVQRSIS